MKSLAHAQQRKRMMRTNGEAWLFLLPFTIPFLFIIVVPICLGLFITFTKWNIIRLPEWIGPANYIKMFNDPTVVTVLANTL